MTSVLPPPVLTPRQRATLKGRAHALEPYVLIGQSGLTDAVVTEVDKALLAHELIKVRVGVGDRHERASLKEQLCARTGAALVQSVGKVAVLWRPRPSDDDPAGTHDTL
jgi:RNA-binding protein